jgi:hypothetical protein
MPNFIHIYNFTALYCPLLHTLLHVFNKQKGIHNLILAKRGESVVVNQIVKTFTVVNQHNTAQYSNILHFFTGAVWCSNLKVHLSANCKASRKSKFLRLKILAQAKNNKLKRAIQGHLRQLLLDVS